MRLSSVALFLLTEVKILCVYLLLVGLIVGWFCHCNIQDRWRFGNWTIESTIHHLLQIVR